MIQNSDLVVDAFLLGGTVMIVFACLRYLPGFQGKRIHLVAALVFAVCHVAIAAVIVTIGFFCAVWGAIGIGTSGHGAGIGEYLTGLQTFGLVVLFGATCGLIPLCLTVMGALMRDSDTVKLCHWWAPIPAALIITLCDYASLREVMAVH